MKKALSSSETSVLARATRRNIPEDTILHTHRRENLKSYTASVVSSSPILVTVMKEALSSSETPVLTRASQRNIPEDTILYSHRRENLKSYNLPVDLLQNWNRCGSRGGRTTLSHRGGCGTRK
jgi:hypothetical protein